VFSQFTSFLDLIQVVLKRERFEQYRFDGSMDVKKRGVALEEFRAPTRKPKVLVVSLKAGGVGLNVSPIGRLSLQQLMIHANLADDSQSCIYGTAASLTFFIFADPSQDGLLVECRNRKPR
jgi:DNA repair protein RAD5